MSGQTLQKAFIPLPTGATAVYTSVGLAYYRHSDHLGSSRLATTPSRTLYSSTAYAPFGEPYAEAGSTDRSFTGKDEDTTSGMYDFLERRYNPTAGRWLSPDPAGLGAVDPTNPQTWNRYAYVGNNPLALVDFLGEDYGYIDNTASGWAWLLSIGGGGGGMDGTVPFGADMACMMDASCAGNMGGPQNNPIIEHANCMNDVNCYFEGFIEQSHQQDMDRYLAEVAAAFSDDAANNGDPNSGTGACTDKLLSAGNNHFGTSFTNSNILKTFQFSMAGPPATYTVNLNISAGSQISMVAPGRYPLHWWTYIIGYGATLHVPNGPGGLDSGLTVPFGKDNDFTEHIDNAYAGWNPLGDMFHGLIDVLGIGRKACP